MENFPAGGIEHRVRDYMKNQQMLPPEGGGILCAVSGGADSMSLLSLLRAILPPLGIRLAAAHYNHRLRGDESNRDDMFVRSFCVGNAIDFFVGGADVAALAGANGLGIEEMAREARYAFLSETAQKNGLDRIATAHNADDNLETIIFNLARGTGLRGLAGIPPVRDNIIRPLLPVSREEVEAYVLENEIAYVTDSSNLSDEYSRNKIRHTVIPLLKEINPAAVGNAFRAAHLIRGDDEYLQSLADEFISAHSSGRRLPAAALAALPRPVAARVVRSMTERSLGETHVSAVLGLCAEDSPSASCDLPGIRVSREYEYIVFGGGGTGIILPGIITPGDNFSLYTGGPRITCKIVRVPPDIHSSLNIFYFKPDSICGRISVRSRQSGDSIKLRGRGVTKTLHKLFIEAKIPREARGLVPVLSDERGLLAVGGFGIAEHAAAMPGENAVLIEINEC